jgi:hypothetical protein
LAKSTTWWSMRVINTLRGLIERFPSQSATHISKQKR